MNSLAPTLEMTALADRAVRDFCANHADGVNLALVRACVQACARAYAETSFESDLAHVLVVPATATLPTIVAFRGTCRLTEWWLDAKARFEVTPVGKVHRGFWASATSVMGEVLSTIYGPVIVTGHSKGAAEALVCARLGDTIAREYSTGYTTTGPTKSNETVMYLNATNGLAGSSSIVVDTPSGIFKSTVSSYGRVANYAVPLASPAHTALDRGNAAYVRTTTSTYFLAGAATTATTLHVASSASFSGADVVLVETVGGARAVATVDSVSTTNITLTGQLGIGTDAADKVWKLGNATTVLIPSDVKATTINLAASNGVAKAATLVLVPTSGMPWRREATTGATKGWAPSVTLADGTPQRYAAGVRLYVLTNAMTLREVAGAADQGVSVDTAAGWTEGDRAVVLPASGGAFLNHYRGKATWYLDTVSFTATLGNALAVGDKMSEQVKFELTKKAQEVLDALGEMPSWGMDAVCLGMDQANQLTLANIQRKHLTGKGPFPVEEHRLGVVTNRLRGGAWASPAVASGTRVSSSIGDNVKYAALHEFGGTVHHKARTGTARLRTDKQGNLLKQIGHANLVIFARMSHKMVKKVDWKSEAYDVEVPERAPFRTGIAEMREEYGKRVSRVLVEAWNSRIK